MEFEKLDDEDKMLIREAKKVITKNRIHNKNISISVGCALLSEKGNVYKGTNIRCKKSTPSSIDAEVSAITQMVTAGDRKIKSIVSIRIKRDGNDTWHIWQPCGSCRHMISQFGNPWVILSNTKKVRNAELYPLEP